MVTVTNGTTLYSSTVKVTPSGGWRSDPADPVADPPGPVAGVHYFDIHRRELHFCSRCGYCLWPSREIDFERDRCPVEALAPEYVRFKMEAMIERWMFSIDYERKFNRYAKEREERVRARKESYTSLSPALRLVGGWNRR